jgi:hypothetical protein
MSDSEGRKPLRAPETMPLMKGISAMADEHLSHAIEEDIRTLELAPGIANKYFTL